MHLPIRTLVFSTALCAGLLFGSALLAQDTTSPGAPDQSTRSMHHGPMSPDQELSHLTEALDLTSDQQTRIKPILESRRDQLVQMRGDASLSRQAKMAKMKSLDDESNTKLETVLNSKQKLKYEQMVARRKERMEQMRTQHNGAGSSQSH